MKKYTLLFVLLAILLVSNKIQCKFSKSPLTNQFEIQTQYMLKLMNQVRSQQRKNLNMLQLDDDLMKMAKAHSMDMVNNNYFSHQNKNNQGPGQRAKKNQFFQSIGENIAIGQQISQIHRNLMNSQPHYLNTINAQWSRCGIGFYKKNKNLIYTTILFSTKDLKKYPVSPQQLRVAKSLIVQYLKTANKQLQQDKDLSQHIKNFIQAKEPTQNIFSYLKIHYPKGNVSYSNASGKIEWSKNLIDTLKNGNMLINNSKNLKKFGINLKIEGSKLNIFVVYCSK